MAKPELGHRILDAVYNRHAEYNPARRGIRFNELAAELQEDEETVTRQARALVRAKRLYAAGEDWVMVNYHHLGELEDELANRGHPKAKEAVEIRRRILERFKQAKDESPPGTLRLRDLAKEFHLNPQQRKAHVSVLTHLGFIGGDDPEAPEIGPRGEQWLAAKTAAPTEEVLTTPEEAREPTESRVTVLFLDIVGSTSTGAVWGEEDLRQMQESLIHMVESIVNDLGPEACREKRFLGDGFMIVFHDVEGQGARTAIDFCRRLLAAIRQYNGRQRPRAPTRMQLRIGIHGGTVRLLPPDYMSGLAIAKAKRLEDLPDAVLGDWPTRGSRVLISEVVKAQWERAVGRELRPAHPYSVRLKGLTDDHRVFKVPLRPTRQAGAQPRKGAGP